LFLRVFNHVGRGSTQWRSGNSSAGLTFLFRERFASFGVTAGSDVNQGERFPMTFVSRLSVVTAYVAIAFVGAIVLGVF
jgi:hypothetical protein